MKRALWLTLVGMLVTVPAGAELRRVELRIYGMD